MKIQSAFTRAIRPIMVGATAIATIALPQIAHADESGVSFWLPGLYGSLAAVPQAAPGWSLFTFNYYDRVSAGADVAARAKSRSAVSRRRRGSTCPRTSTPRWTSNGSNRTTPSRPRFSAGS